VFTATAIFGQDIRGRPHSRPVVLLPGLGHHQHPIATTNPEAQKFFDQGLILVYGFNRGEAIRLGGPRNSIRNRLCLIEESLWPMGTT
jgi:hypothetical protein